MFSRVRCQPWGTRLLALAALVAACGRAPASSRAGAPASTAPPDAFAYPVRVRDERGVVVTLRAEPQRIVSLLPSHTETLFALGVGARVVGVDDYSDVSPGEARLPTLGGLYDTRLEAVLALRPDLVLLSEPSAAAAALEQSGITVWAGSARSYDDVFRVVETIGQMVGQSGEAQRLSRRIRDEVAVIESRLQAIEPVRVYYELDGNLYTVGPSSFIGTMIAKARGDNVVRDGLGDFPKISPEAVVSGNPSIILGASLEDVATRPGWSQIAAVRSSHVYKLPKEESQLVLRPGPRIAESLRVLARRLHPEVSL